MQGSLLYEYATLSVKLEFTGGIVSKPTLYNRQSTGRIDKISRASGSIAVTSQLLFIDGR